MKSLTHAVLPILLALAAALDVPSPACAASAQPELTEEEAARARAAEECRARSCACREEESVLDASDSTAAGSFTQPRALRSPVPRYTARARAAGLQGVVLLEMIVDEKGRVCCPRIVKGLPMGLDTAALKAVKGWRYEPATRDGRPVCVFQALTMTFALR